MKQIITILTCILTLAFSFVANASNTDPLTGLSNNDVVKIGLKSMHSGVLNDDRGKLEFYINVMLFKQVHNGRFRSLGPDVQNIPLAPVDLNKKITLNQEIEISGREINVLARQLVKEHGDKFVWNGLRVTLMEDDSFWFFGFDDNLTSGSLYFQSEEVVSATQKGYIAKNDILTEIPKTLNVSDPNNVTLEKSGAELTFSMQIERGAD